MVMWVVSLSAPRLSARDQWIGWNDDACRQNLNQVVNNSRFLIVPHVKVKNLASHVLALVAKCVADDWLERYEMAPALLETFVGRERFTGASYRAANWIHLGVTKGRGRQYSANQYAAPVKDIYVYSLRADAKAILCEGPCRAPSELSRCEPVDWAEEELGTMENHDGWRLTRVSFSPCIQSGWIWVMIP